MKAYRLLHPHIFFRAVDDFIELDAGEVILLVGTSKNPGDFWTKGRNGPPDYDQPRFGDIAIILHNGVKWFYVSQAFDPDQLDGALEELWSS